MITIKFKELLARKERQQGKRISLETVSKFTGISIATLSRLSSPKKYRTNTDILDQLCQYFECDICDLIGFTPERKSSLKTLAVSDIKKRRRALEEQLPRCILSKLPNIGVVIRDVKFNQMLSSQDSNNKFLVDITGFDAAGKVIFIVVKPILYHTQTLQYLKQLIKLNPNKIIVVTCSEKFPVDLANTRTSEVDYLLTNVVFDEIQNKIVGLNIEKYLPYQNII